MKRFIAVLFVVTFGVMANVAEASHFRYGTISWTREPGTRKVTFTVIHAWRVGPYVNLQFGDGASSGGLANTLIQSEANFAVHRSVTTHTYSHDGPFEAFFAGCCRIGGIANAGGGFRIGTTVDLSNGNNGSPVSSAPVVLQMVHGGLNQVPLPVADPQGDDLTFSMGTIGGSGGAYSVPSAGGHTLDISSDGVLTWDTSGTTIGKLWTARVLVDEDRSASRAEIDFFIEIVDGTLNAAPTCELNGNASNVVPVGTPFNISITASDPDGGNLTASPQGLPPGASLSPISGPSPLTTNFSWTPSPSDIGTAYAIAVTFTDDGGLQTTCSFSVSVPANSSPVAVCQDITLALDETGVVVLESASQIDGGSLDPDGDPITLSFVVNTNDGSPVFDCDSLGQHTATLTVTDDKGASDSCTATVTVIDNIAPVITLNGNTGVTLECGVDTYTEQGATATDNCDAPTVVNGGDTVDASTPGTYIVTYDAADASGNSAVQVVRMVVVQDTIDPVIESLAADPGALWPPNHKMVPVTLTASVSDNCDQAPQCRIVDVSSNEPVNDIGDGNTDVDWLVTGDMTLELRAERAGPLNSRVYTITVECSDASGNSTTDTVEVIVPHDQGKGKGKKK